MYSCNHSKSPNSLQTTYRVCKTNVSLSSLHPIFLIDYVRHSREYSDFRTMNRQWIYLRFTLITVNTVNLHKIRIREIYIIWKLCKCTILLVEKFILKNKTGRVAMQLYPQKWSYTQLFDIIWVHQRRTGIGTQKVEPIRPRTDSEAWYRKRGSGSV